MNRTFVQLAMILALLTLVIQLYNEAEPFSAIVLSGLIFIAAIFIVLIGFYFMRSGISFMENQNEDDFLPPEDEETMEPEEA
tara:strand:- start:2157 stop:2402 length:246 start_codon:yes stop_codon:yes gene_type:complete